MRFQGTRVLAGAVSGIIFSLFAGTLNGAISSTTYPFSTIASTALEDMSSGTTQLLGPDQDNVASTVQLIGFDFWFNGVRQSQFSVSSNGLCNLGQNAVTSFQDNSGFANTNNFQIAPYFDDLWIGNNGKVHYKVVGSAPNRRLVVEWLNMQVPRVGANQAGAGTFQMWLSESTGVINFIYGGGMASNSANGGYTVGLQAASFGNLASVTTVTPSVSYTTANNTQSTAINSGRQYAFTPVVPNAPTNLTFTSTTPTGTTLNWADNAGNEVGYAIYQSTDNMAFTFVAQTAANATSQAVSSLMPNTTYFFKVYAVSDGALSAALSGSKLTLPASVSSTATGGNWSAPPTWVGGVVPTIDQDVMIVDGASVTIDVAAVAKSLTLGTGAGAAANLIWDAVTPRTLNVATSVMIASNGHFQSANSGTVKTHLLTVGADLINEGTIDFVTNIFGGVAGADITFTGGANNTFGGTGSRTSVQNLTVDKGNSPASVLELTAANFLHGGSNLDTGAGFLTLNNGTLKISGTFMMQNRVFKSVSYFIPATAGFWLNNPNFTVLGQSGNATNNGLLRISQGSLTVGTNQSHTMAVTSPDTATFLIEGGTFNMSGAFSVQNPAVYTQTGGTVNVAITGNNFSSTPSFAVISATSTFNMSGGTINLIQPCTAATNAQDYAVDAVPNVTGGTLNIGTPATATNFLFRIRGNTPALVIDNTTNNKSALLFGQTVIWGNATLSTGTGLGLNGFLCSFNGPTITNNGSLVGTTAGSRCYFNGSVPQTYTGTGSVTAPLATFEIDNPTGLTIDPSVNQIVVLALALYNGSLTNTNKLTLGNGGSTSGTVAIGSTTGVTSPGTFDAAPNFNLGTGGEVVKYQKFSPARSTGPEIHPSRSLATLVRDDDATAPAELTVAGGDLTVTAALFLTNARIVTGANTLVLGTSASVTRTNGSVEGNFRKTFTAAGSKTYELGTNGGYGPLEINNATGSFPATVTASSHRGRHPNYQSINSTKRYWSTSAPAGFGADLKFQYPGNDIGTRNEANFKIAKYTGSITAPASTVDTVNNKVGVAAAAAAPLSADWFIFELADADFDGMPDAYETAKGFLINDPADANADFDGDGQSNLSEYNAGTDPKNAADYLRITSIAKNDPAYPAPNVLVRCSAVDLKLYRLDYKNAITDGSWIFLRFSDPHTGLPTAPLPDITIGAGTRRFYRATLDVNDQL